MTRSIFKTLLLLSFALIISAGRTAGRLRNYGTQQEIDPMEERIDVLYDELETNGSAKFCKSNDDCIGLPHCDNSENGNGCFCQLPEVGLCDGDDLLENVFGKCRKPRLGCNKMYKPVFACDGTLYSNRSCANAAGKNVLCYMNDQDCAALFAPTDDAGTPSSDMD
jgi:hypothetical protein